MIFPRGPRGKVRCFILDHERIDEGGDGLFSGLHKHIQIRQVHLKKKIKIELFQGLSSLIYLNFYVCFEKRVFEYYVPAFQVKNGSG